LIIMKFGGSSVADAGRIRGVVEIIAAHARKAETIGERPVVVVSALGGVTDLLVSAARAAGQDDLPAQESAVAEIERRHRWAISGCFDSLEHRHDLEMVVTDLFEELRLLLRSVRTLGELTLRTMDAVLATGELLSSRLLSAALASAGIPSCWIDPRKLLVTDHQQGDACPNPEQLQIAVRELVLPVVEAGEVVVTGGFVGRSSRGITTTLGRGGGDTTAASLAAAADAAELQIWTDVDGLMTADPRLVPDALPLEFVTFAEASEMACFGAKVLHPASMAPALASRIPVRVLNSMKPDRRGTLILENAEAAVNGVVSITSRSSMFLVKLESDRSVPGSTFRRQFAKVMEETTWETDLVVQTEVGAAALFRDEQEAARFQEACRPIGPVLFQDEMALVVVVGENLRRDALLRSKVATDLAADRFELVLGGAAAISLCTLVPQNALETLVQALHASFFQKEAQR
jgi:aspartate kinase